MVGSYTIMTHVKCMGRIVVVFIRYAMLFYTGERETGESLRGLFWAALSRSPLRPLRYRRPQHPISNAEDVFCVQESKRGELSSSFHGHRTKLFTFRYFCFSQF